MSREQKLRDQRLVNNTSSSKCESVTHTYTQTQAQTDDRQTHSQRHTDRETDTHAKTDRQIHSHRQTKKQRNKDTHTYKLRRQARKNRMQIGMASSIYYYKHIIHWANQYSPSSTADRLDLIR